MFLRSVRHLLSTPHCPKYVSAGAQPRTDRHAHPSHPRTFSSSLFQLLSLSLTHTHTHTHTHTRSLSPPLSFAVCFSFSLTRAFFFTRARTHARAFFSHTNALVHTLWRSDLALPSNWATQAIPAVQEAHPPRLLGVHVCRPSTPWSRVRVHEAVSPPREPHALPARAQLRVFDRPLRSCGASRIQRVHLASHGRHPMRCRVPTAAVYNNVAPV